MTISYDHFPLIDRTVSYIIITVTHIYPTIWSKILFIYLRDCTTYISFTSNQLEIIEKNVLLFVCVVLFVYFFKLALLNYIARNFDPFTYETYPNDWSSFRKV